MFNRDDYVKIVDTRGNYRFGFIERSQEHGDILTINLCDEGISKVCYDDEYAQNMGVGPRNFQNLLTETEKRYIPLLAQQQTTKQMAENLKISPVTVRSHIRELKIKLGIETREQLFAYAQGIEKVINGQEVHSGEDCRVASGV